MTFKSRSSTPVCLLFGLTTAAATHSVIFNSSSHYINSHLKAVCSVPCERDAQSLSCLVLMPQSLFLFISQQHPDSHFLMFTVGGLREGWVLVVLFVVFVFLNPWCFKDQKRHFKIPKL